MGDVVYWFNGSLLRQTIKQRPLELLSTLYAAYPIRRELLHWESQCNTTQNQGQYSKQGSGLTSGVVILALLNAILAIGIIVRKP